VEEQSQKQNQKPRTAEDTEARLKTYRSQGTEDNVHHGDTEARRHGEKLGGRAKSKAKSKTENGRGHEGTESTEDEVRSRESEVNPATGMA